MKNNDDAEEEESGDAVKNVVDKAVLYSFSHRMMMKASMGKNLSYVFC